MWRVVKDSSIPLHSSLIGFGVSEYPYTISYVIRRRQMIESFNEIPKEKRPPKSIWDSPSELSEWFDRVYGDKQTEFEFKVDEREIEG